MGATRNGGGEAERIFDRLMHREAQRLGAGKSTVRVPEPKCLGTSMDTNAWSTGRKSTLLEGRVRRAGYAAGGIRRKGMTVSTGRRSE